METQVKKKENGFTSITTIGTGMAVVDISGRLPPNLMCG
jgi:hypothetical protein